MIRTFAGLLALTLLSPLALAQDGDAASNEVFKVEALGSGCPDGIESYHWEASTLVLNFADYKAEKGPGLSLAASRAACTITLTLRVPRGLRYALHSYSLQGSQVLGESDKNLASVSAFFQGTGVTASHADELTADAGDDLRLRHVFPAAERVWSPCDATRSLSVTTSVRVSGSDRQSPASSEIRRVRLPLILGLCPAS